MRIDRLLTVYVFRPLARLRQPRGLRIPILMYHSISDEPETGHPYYWINTSPALFAEHMKFLHDHDYRVIPLSAAVDMIRENSKFQIPNSKGSTRGSDVSTNQPINVPTVLISQSASNPSALAHQRQVVLTFDDGYADFFSAAFPELQRHGFTATVFPPTDYIDGTKPGLRGKQHLTWDQVRDLAAAGITFGSHTCSHPQLHDLDEKTIREELDRSRAAIEEKVGHCEGFCFPYKFPESDPGFVRRLGAMLEDGHFSFCLSTRIGTLNSASDLFALRRIPVNSGDDLPLFSAKLSGGYDWLSTLQSLRKTLRSAA